jgi:hypothetical protein
MKPVMAVCVPLAAMLAVSLAPSAAPASTGPDLRSRISIDGHTSDWATDEALFGLNPSGTPQEPADDSKWGGNEDIRQIRITWDHRAVYLALEATIWGNNVILALDAREGAGLTTMSGLNSWARIFDFAGGFAPDFFGCTWDGNPTPHLVIHRIGTMVEDHQVGGGLFGAASSFWQAAPDRAMELRVPWSVVFAGLTRDTVLDVAGAPDSITLVPAGATVKLAGFVTAAGDNTSGPDSAPNNTGGHTANCCDLVVIDNFVTVRVDEDQDGIPDAGVSPLSRAVIHDPTTPVPGPTWGRLKARYAPRATGE